MTDKLEKIFFALKMAAANDISITLKPDEAKHLYSLRRKDTGTEWISVKDRLPEIDEDILTFNGTEVGQDIYIVFNGEHMFYSETVCPEEVAHWMPLPEPPEVHP